MKNHDIPLAEQVIAHYIGRMGLDRREAIRYIADDIAFCGLVRFAKDERLVALGAPQTFLDQFNAIYDREVVHPH